MLRYYRLYVTPQRRCDIQEITLKEYIRQAARKYLFAIVHDDGTINLTKGRNIITLSQEHLEKLLQLTKPMEAQA